MGGGAALLGNVIRGFHVVRCFWGMAAFHGGPVLAGSLIASGQTHWNGGFQVVLSGNLIASRQTHWNDGFQVETCNDIPRFTVCNEVSY